MRPRRPRSPVPRRVLETELEALWDRSGLPGGYTVSWPARMVRRHLRSPRSYAQVEPDLPPSFELAEQARWLGPEHRLGLLAHEVGHVLDPGGGEEDADEAARRALGVQIEYDHRWPGKGLQRGRFVNPDIDVEARDWPTTASWAMTPHPIWPGVWVFSTGVDCQQRRDFYTGAGAGKFCSELTYIDVQDVQPWIDRELRRSGFKVVEHWSDPEGYLWFRWKRIRKWIETR